MREDIENLSDGLLGTSKAAAKAYGRFRDSLSEVSAVLPQGEAVTYLHFPADLMIYTLHAQNHPGILFVTTRRLVFWALGGAHVNIRLSEVSQCIGSRGDSWTDRNDSYLRLVTIGGSRHTFRFLKDREAANRGSRAVSAAQLME